MKIETIIIKMSCFLCYQESNYNKNTFSPPEEPTYFISQENYKSYYNLNDNNNFNKEIKTLSSLFPAQLRNDSNHNININSGNKSRGALHKEIDFVPRDYNNIKYPNLEVKCYSIKNPTNLKNEIILLRIRNKCFDIIDKNQKYDYSEDSDSIKDIKISDKSLVSIDSESIDKQEKITLIISHSASKDLGIIFPIMYDLSIMLKCDVISYDYMGYGCSNGSPNYDSLKNDLITVLDFSTITFDIKYEDIILMAFNIGAISSIYVGGLPNHCSIRGMILVSPQLDFMKKKFDYDYINEVICPVFIIQGEFENNMDSQKIIEFAKKFKESIYWIPNKVNDYEEIIAGYRLKFYKKIRKFLAHVHTTRKKISQSISNSVNSSLIFK